MSPMQKAPNLKVTDDQLRVVDVVLTDILRSSEGSAMTRSRVRQDVKERAAMWAEHADVMITNVGINPRVEAYFKLCDVVIALGKGVAEGDNGLHEIYQMTIGMVIQLRETLD